MDFAVIGKTTTSKKLNFISIKKQVADIPIDFLAEDAPEYDRKWKKTKLPQKIKFKKRNFKSLKINNCLKNYFQIQIFVKKNGYGISTTTQLWGYNTKTWW